MEINLKRGTGDVEENKWTFLCIKIFIVVEIDWKPGTRETFKRIIEQFCILKFIL